MHTCLFTVATDDGDADDHDEVLFHVSLPLGSLIVTTGLLTFLLKPEPFQGSPCERI